MDELLQSFILESQELLDDFEDTLLGLEKEYNKESVDKLFRAIHTVKGNSGLFNLKNITDLSHSLESQLNKLRNEEITMQPSHIDIYLTTVDLIRKMVGSPDVSGNFDIKPLVATLDALGRGESVDAGSLQAPVQSTSEPVSESEHEQLTDDALEQPKPSPESETSGTEITPEHLEDAIIKMEVDAPKEWLRQLLLAFEYFHYNAYDATTSLWNAARHAIQQVIDDKIEISMPLVDQLLIIADMSRKSPDFFSSQDIDHSFNSLKDILGNIPLIQRPDSAPIIFAESLFEGKVFASTVDIQAEVKPSTAEAPKDEAQPPAKPRAEKKNKPAPPIKPAVSPTAEVSLSSDAERKETHIKVSLDLIDSLINLAGETIVARNELVRRIENIGDPKVAASGKKIGQLITRMQEFIMITRMQPIEVTFHKLPRIIRDLERATSKKITLLVEGGEIELDKTLIDALGDPLMHIIRNSVDHGIELPEERLEKGKSEDGNLHVKAMLKAGNVTIFVQDDGKGIDTEVIKAKAVEKGIITHDHAISLSDHEAIELIFHPGFSTAEKVTQVSGRGVGMDVVRSNIQRIGGTVNIKSELDKGTLMTINLPQTLSIITSLVISSGNHRLAIPQQNLERLILIQHSKLMYNKDKMFIRLSGQLIPVFHLLSVLDNEHLQLPLQGQSSHLVIVQSDGQRAGLIVDEIINSEEIVIKSLGSLYSGAQLFSGAAVLGDGSAVLILDVPGFYRFVNYNATNAELIAEKILEEKSESEDLRYVVFEIHQNQFAFEVDGHCRIIKIANENRRDVLEKPALFLESELIPLFKLEDLLPDLDLLSHYDENYALVVKHGVSFGIMLDQIMTLATGFESVDESKLKDEAIQGVGVFNGEPITILSLSRLEALATERQQEIINEGSNDG